ncbi:MAG: hypothetical protein ACXVB9_00050 [Bdellovibrionota bacterium]
MEKAIYPILATVAFALLLVGFFLRKSGPGRHALLMSTGMLIDLLLVLTLEFSKNAVATALGPELTGPQRMHVTASTLAVLFYLPLSVLGWIRLFRPSEANLNLRTWHRRLGYCAIFLRTIGFLFMFTMLGRTAV